MESPRDNSRQAVSRVADGDSGDGGIVHRPSGYLVGDFRRNTHSVSVLPFSSDGEISKEVVSPEWRPVR
jgi:hypothetical protein